MKLIGAGARAVPVLDQWLRFDPGLLNLTGAAGLGKRSVIKALCGDDVRVVRFQGQVAPEALLTTLARQMGITPGDVSATIKAVRTQAAQVREANYWMLVVLENAERLPESTLALLARLAEPVDEAPGLAIALLSEQSMRETIRPLLAPSMTFQDVALVPFSHDETNEMADFCLTQGPWSGDAVASLDRAALFEVTGGNPGQIEQAIERHRAGLPLTGPVPGRKRVATVFGVALVLALGLSAVMVWQWYQPASGPVERVSEVDRLADLEKEIAKVPPAPEPLPAAEPVAIDLALLPDVLPPPDLPPDVIIPLPAPAEVVLPSAESIAEVATETVAPLQDEVQSQSPAETPQTEPQWGFDEAQILSLASESYTLQVFGTRDPAAAGVLKRGKYADLGLNIARVQRDGSPWYIGLLGSFETRQAAQIFASDQRIENGFWLRSLGSVQTQIREAVQ